MEVGPCDMHVTCPSNKLDNDVRVGVKKKQGQTWSNRTRCLPPRLLKDAPGQCADVQVCDDAPNAKALIQSPIIVVQSAKNTCVTIYFFLIS